MQNRTAAYFLLQTLVPILIPRCNLTLLSGKDSSRRYFAHLCHAGFFGIKPCGKKCER
jgi:hypothetical protein